MRWRSKKYLDWIRQQPCWYCGRPARPHHIKGVGHMSGVGLKAPDFTAMPLCDPCHEVMQREPTLWPDQWEIIVRTLGRAIDEGILIVNGSLNARGGTG